tara:strand:- start:16380 stop:17978 length:1599 start_codon:yes stop_codon:yes gene_type:complete
MPASVSNHAANVNHRARSHWARWLLCLTTAAIGCGGATKKALIFEQTVAIPAGRFAGPIEVQLPRRPADSIRDYEIRTELLSACGPRLRMSYPDGEVTTVGPASPTWQSLLARRAEAGEVETAPPDTQNSSTPEPAAPLPAAPEPAAPEPAAAGPGQYQPGRWQQTTIESWPGQMEFMRTRDHRCAQIKRYKKTYTTAFDETGRLTIWAEVPQELAGTTLNIEVYEVIDVDREQRIATRERNYEKREARRLAAEERALANVEVNWEQPAQLAVKPRKAKPRPPMPKPKKEEPKAAKAEGAQWTSGHWQWTAGKGEWVWVRGYWLAPAQTPPLKRGPGAPPVAGCTWNPGRWVWQQRDGSWRWIDGSWNAPPPKVENPGAPPVPESPWVAGRWSRTKLSFTWIAGHWDKPRPRVETPTTPPFAGANWQAGTWLQLKGKWIWSPGYYAESIKPPPAPKREVAGTSPAPGAVWLAGFWRWSPEKSSYRWIPGHWEKPPGAGYEWIPDPPDPNVGRSVGGHWKIIVDVPVNIEVRP